MQEQEEEEVGEGQKTYISPATPTTSTFAPQLIFEDQFYSNQTNPEIDIETKLESYVERGRSDGERKQERVGKRSSPNSKTMNLTLPWQADISLLPRGPRKKKSTV